jgi:hypothetical protein
VTVPIVLRGQAVGLAILSLTRFDRALMQEFRDTFVILLAMHHLARASAREPRRPESQ